MPDSIPASDISSRLGVNVGSRAPAARIRFLRIGRSGAGRVGIGLTGGLLVLALLAGGVTPADPLASVGPPLSPPSLAHPMGTDDLGRDLLAAVAHGTRTSLSL